ncbi:hypothetical protein LCGC14_2957280 [marine sediment metagenome]|uniref:Uncharacterized protein n=1 Tax=marine sediment metagenome TaxID=412755 RepID=A0A0F8XE37_9ZZZZ
MRYIFKKLNAPLIGAIVCAMMLGVGSVSAEGVLKVYNWAEYIAKDTISNFEKEYNIIAKAKKVSDRLMSLTFNQKEINKLRALIAGNPCIERKWKHIGKGK